MEREKYISLFFDESKENLLALNDYLLELEKGSGDLHLLNDIFRVAHTLKGMSATMGYKEITLLTHEMENLLDFLRNAQLTVNNEIIDVLFLCLDALEGLIDNIISNDSKIVDTTNLMYRLKKLIRQGSGTSEIEEYKGNIEERDTYSSTYNDQEKNLIVESIQNGYSVSEIEVLLMKDSMMKAIRVLLVLQTIESKAKIIKTTPDREVLNSEKFGRNFLISVIHPGNIDEIKNSVLSIAEVAKVYSEDISEKFKNDLNELSEIDSKSNIIVDYSDIEKNVLLEAINHGLNGYEIYVSFKSETIMKAVRATMILNTLNSLECELIKCIPSSDDFLTDKLGDNFILTVISDKNKEKIKSSILDISEIEQVEILDISKFYFSQDKSTITTSSVKLPEFNDYEKVLINEANNLNNKVLLIGIYLMPGTIMKYARYMIVSKKLESIGEVIKTIPNQNDIENEKFDNYFQIVLITNIDNSFIKEIISTVSEIESSIEINSLVINEGRIILEPEQIVNSKSENIENLQDTKRIENKINTDIKDNIKSNEVKSNKVITDKIPENKNTQANSSKKTTIRVDMERLDELINLVEELTIVKNRLSKISLESEYKELVSSVRNLSMISGNLQNNAMRLRMIPVESIFNRFPRMIRDVAKSLNKEINFVIEGQDTELDRTVIDEIGDPLVHLLRNSIDHGIEIPEKRIKSGKDKVGIIKLIARHEGNNVLIIVEDDGNGIDIERVKEKALEKKIITFEQSENMSEDELKKLIFLPGFSTNDTANDLSGRGVGMDAVLSKIKSIGGSINIYSELGQGSRFTIKLPLTLAIMEVLMVELGDETYAIPITFIEEVREFLPEEIRSINKVKVTVIRDKTVPLLELSEILKVRRTRVKTVPDPEIYTEVIPTVIVRTEEGKKTSGLIVDRIIGQEDVVIKPLGRIASDKKNYISGTANLGDGNLALILNVTSIT